MSIFPTKILLATDGSDDADLALLTAVDVANCTDSELHLVTVSRGRPDPIYGTGEFGFQYETYEEALRAVVQEAQEVLDEQVRKVEEAGGTVAGAHLKKEGPKDRAIVELAEELGVGLIVMGSRGLGGIRRALMGSVSDSGARYAHCPVMVVREQAKSAASSEGQRTKKPHLLRREVVGGVYEVREATFEGRAEAAALAHRGQGA